MNEITLFDGSAFDLVMSLNGIADFLKMSFSLYLADGTTHIGVGWFVLMGWLLLMNVAKAKRGKRA